MAQQENNEAQNEGHYFERTVFGTLQRLFVSTEPPTSAQLELIKSDNFQLGYRQTEDRYRLDALFRIKRDSDKLFPFWLILPEHFDSFYVVVECKFYQAGVPEEQVLLTEKYLYPKAKRSVCLLFSGKCQKGLYKRTSRPRETDIADRKNRT